MLEVFTDSGIKGFFLGKMGVFFFSFLTIAFSSIGLTSVFFIGFGNGFNTSINNFF